ncbi:MAG: phosphoribosyltransferase [Alphaproteobacteria bacterium]|nr:phosphoribosyltransferase [Alphaproteobacteria bacterium]
MRRHDFGLYGFFPMGIDVDKQRRVTHNATHERRVVTGLNGNPSIEIINGIEITNIFTRKRVQGGTEDGNPLIYALKRKWNYSIDRQSKRDLARNFDAISDIALHGKFFDYIVPLPSSSYVVRLVARGVHIKQPGARLLRCLQKATMGQMLAQMPAVGSVPDKLRGDYTSLLSHLRKQSPNHVFQMKLVDPKLRPYLPPLFVADNTAARCSGASVLLIDDLCSTGASFAAAQAVLSPHNPRNLKAFSLLSRVYP